MIAQHQHNDRQDDERVMFRSRFGSLCFFLVWIAPRFECGDHPALRRENAHPDVSDHYGSKDGPELDTSGAGTENPKQPIDRGQDQAIANNRPNDLLFEKFGTPEEIVNQPANHQRSQANPKRGKATYWPVLRGNELPAMIIYERQQQKAAEPGDGSLP